MVGKSIFVILGMAMSAPAAASVLTVGSSDARMCYMAADAEGRPSVDDLDRCNVALSGEALSPFDIVATHVNRGILRMRLGNIDAAIADFDRAIQLDPNQAEAYLNKGMALMRREQPADARQLFTIALDRRTLRPAIAHYGRGVASETLGDLRSAYADYRRARELAPNWREPRIELARFQVRGN